MKKTNSDIFYRWTLRLRYLWAFFAGAVLTSAGFSAILGCEKISEREELNTFVSISTITIGIALIIVGFYVRHEVENHILKNKL
ncbi:hypothetical protein [Lacinutrix chionoecetis]